MNIHLTFKGKYIPNKFNDNEFSRGWNDAFEYVLNNYEEGGCQNFLAIGYDVYGEQTSFYWNGFREGILSGCNKCLDIKYPNARSLSYNRVTKKYDATY